MKLNVLSPTTLTENLSRHVNNTCRAHGLQLDALQQSYLAHLVVRYADCSALQSAQFYQQSGLASLTMEQLLTYGDECLLLAGMPSGCELHDDVKVLYGRLCYRHLADQLDGASQLLYRELAKDFIAMAHTLRILSAQGVPSHITDADKYHKQSQCSVEFKQHDTTQLTSQRSHTIH